MENAKVGQRIEVTQDFTISGFDNKKVIVKKGDSGFIDSNNFIHYITGNAEGMIQGIKGWDIKGYDVNNITKMVFDHIDNYFGLLDILQFYDVNVIGFKEIIFKVIDSITKECNTKESISSEKTALSIVNELKKYYILDNILSAADIETKKLKEEIECILDEIL